MVVEGALVRDLRDILLGDVLDVGSSLWKDGSLYVCVHDSYSGFRELAMLSKRPPRFESSIYLDNSAQGRDSDIGINPERFTLWGFPREMAYGLFYRHNGELEIFDEGKLHPF